MSDTRDPFELAQAREREAEELQQRSDALGEEVEQTRQEWERKRRDDHVPGAPAPEGSGEGQSPESPAPQAPPPSEGPAKATTPPEGAVGEPAETFDEED